MLYTLRSKPVFRETPRYILLYNLLFGDTYQLALSQLVYILAFAKVYMMYYICSIIVSFGVLTSNISPLTLAVMSLERYVAVCYPLRHAAFVTIRVGVIIIFSYFGVMVAARSASSDKASTSKARETVLLHLIQLCLSVSTTLNSPILIAIANSGADMQKLLRIPE
ncbi:odorant receptor 131-2-like [Aplochiton taeniatus]